MTDIEILASAFIAGKITAEDIDESLAPILLAAKSQAEVIDTLEFMSAGAIKTTLMDAGLLTKDYRPIAEIMHEQNRRLWSYIR